MRLKYRCKRVWIVWIVICILGALHTPEAHAASANENLKLFVVYDSAYRYGISQPVLVSLQEFLGHFDVEQTAVRVDDWQPGALRGADIVVFLGLRNTELPPALLTEMAGAKKILWLEKNIKQMTDALGWDDFRFKGIKGGWTSVVADAQEHAVIEPPECVITEPGEGSVVLGEVKNISERAVFSWKRDNLYYLGCLDFFEPALTEVFVNMLYRVIPEQYAQTYSYPKKMLLRVEDVSPIVDPEAVQAVIDEIERYDIPYAIGVIPVGVYENGSQVYLHQAPKLVKVLQAAQRNGASIIMHGYTHQNEFSPKTGEGWEFWNARDDKPMEDDAAFTRERIEKSFIELARCGLYPVAFEPPHYAMSKKGYEVLSEYFNIFSGMPQTSDASYMISLTLPYVVKSQYLNGMIVVPENMGYYDGVDFRVEDMLHNSEELLGLKDQFACFFYHGYLPPDNVHRVIEGAWRQGYSFFDLRTMDVKARSSQVQVVVEHGTVSAVIDPDLVAQWKREAQKKTGAVEKASWVQVALLALIILGLVGIIVNLRKNAWRKYETAKKRASRLGSPKTQSRHDSFF